jgi:hypothetical protein
MEINVTELPPTMAEQFKEFETVTAFKVGGSLQVSAGKPKMKTPEQIAAMTLEERFDELAEKVADEAYRLPFNGEPAATSAFIFGEAHFVVRHDGVDEHGDPIERTSVDGLCVKELAQRTKELAVGMAENFISFSTHDFWDGGVGEMVNALNRKLETFGIKVKDVTDDYICCPEEEVALLELSTEFIPGLCGLLEDLSELMREDKADMLILSRESPGVYMLTGRVNGGEHMGGEHMRKALKGLVNGEVQ